MKKRGRPLLFFAQSLLLLTGCRSAAISKWEQLSIKLTRAGCMDMCPEYELTISGDGSVAYRGLRYVAIAGERKARIGEEEIRLLVSEFEKANFYALADSYENAEITDQENVITSITVDGKTKSVAHYHGDFRAPRSLTLLEDKIDQVTQSSQWVMAK